MSSQDGQVIRHMGERTVETGEQTVALLQRQTVGQHNRQTDRQSRSPSGRAA